MMRNGHNGALKLIEDVVADESQSSGDAPCVCSIRECTGLSQTAFARLLGVSVRTLQEWEQGRRIPSGAARTLLQIAHRNPQALREIACLGLP